MESVYAAPPPPTQIDFPSMITYFKTFDESDGIFILKDDAGYVPDATYGGAVAIVPASGFLDNYDEFKYEALVQSPVNGVMQWMPTEFFTIPNDGQIIKDYTKTVSYKLLKNAPVGKYGVRVTAYIGGTPEKNYTDANAAYSGGQLVESVYCVVYGQPLSYIYCEDARGWPADSSASAVSAAAKYQGNSFYKVSQSGNGLGKALNISVTVNPGAIAPEEGDTSGFGNLTLDTGISVDSLSMQVESLRGKLLDWSTISTTPREQAVQNGVITLNLPKRLAVGKYVLRVWHSSNPDISGTFIIDNGGTGVAAGSDSGGAVFLIMGLVVLLLGAVLFITPQIIAYLETGAAEREEKRRLKRAGIETKKQKDQASRTAYQNVQAITKKLEEDKNLSQVERDNLIRQREEEYAKTKSGGFLQKLHENRMKREMARDSGISMVEFQKVEEQRNKIEDAKKSGLSAIRNELGAQDSASAASNSPNDGEVYRPSSVAITMQQENAQKAALEATRRKRKEDGEPEFDLLDSLKNDAAAANIAMPETQKTDIEKAKEANAEAKKEAEVEKGTSLLERLRKFTGEE